MSNSSAGMRIAALLDAGSFVEIGKSVTARATTFNMSAKETPSDGVITGYGTIENKPVYVYSQDASVLGGTLGEMHAKKIVKIYDLALKTGAPVVGLIDCAGLRLEEATDALNAFGELFMCQVKASGVIPQITGIFGTCGGGMSIVPTLTDFTVMEAKKASLYVSSPNTMADKNAAEVSTADFQSVKTGIVEAVEGEEEAVAKLREIVAILPANCEDLAEDECNDNLNRVLEDADASAKDAALLISMIADNGKFVEIKPAYAKNMVTGFIRLNGQTVGCVANRSVIYDAEGNEAESFDGRLTANGCGKAARFVKFCDAFNIPVLTLTDACGLKADKHQEVNISKRMAELVLAYGSATVPMVNVVTGKAYGTAYVVMNPKSLGADLVFAWPEASIGMMDAKSAARIIYASEIAAGDGATVLAEKTALYEEAQQSPEAAAKRGYVDAIIEPADTRKHVIAAFEMLYTKRDAAPAKKHASV